MSVYLGCDIGTVSLKCAAVVVDPDLAERVRERKVLVEHSLSGKVNGPLRGYHFFLSPYRRINGSPAEAARAAIEEMSSHFPPESLASVVMTGSGARLPAKRLGLVHHSDFRSVATGVSLLYPEVELILEMGGENSKYVRLEKQPDGLRVGIADYDTNGDCAAGTGSFIDQQSSRLCYRVEEIGDVACGAGQAAKIAGRCSVFAKSDMIHAQQKGATPPQILKGLCEAVARNFKGNVAKGRELRGRSALVGGVAGNRGVSEAVREVFGTGDGELFVPESPAFYGALGAALIESLAGGECRYTHQPELGKLPVEEGFPCWAPLSLEKVCFPGGDDSTPVEEVRAGEGGLPVATYLGIDIGSVSTNLVLIDARGDVLHEIYLRTQGRPIEVVNRGLQEIDARFGRNVMVCGVGTTGSGRELIGELIGADTVRDEITAHKTGAAHVAEKYLDRPVDAIFEVGGQDAKFISLDHGVVVDFTMNEACAAGTGSFLEEQAEKLDVSIVGEFAERALRSRAPIRLGERCTVYMEMDVTSFVRNGADRDDILAGLAYSVVQNYLNRVVRGRPIGETVFFQGGTAYNRAVAAAFAAVTGKKIIVPPLNGVMGAYGAALLAFREVARSGRGSSFRGFDIDRVDYSVREFTCRACSNECDIQEFCVEGEKSYWGDKCSDRFRRQAKAGRAPVIADLFADRQERLEKDWLGAFSDGDYGTELKKATDRVDTWIARHREPGPRFGMLRAMYYYHRHPFWKTYLEALGGEVVVTGPTSKSVVNAGIEATVAEPCFPIQVAHGHLQEMAAMEIDFAVIPSHINDLSDDADVQSHVCPFGQTLPFLLKHSPALRGLNGSLLIPLVHFRQGLEFVEKELWRQLGHRFAGRRHHRLAVSLAYFAQKLFQEELYASGREALDRIAAAGESAIVLVGRPYNLYDPGLNLNLAAKLRRQYGVNVVPLDFICTDAEDLNSLNSNMFWNFGRKILRTTIWSSKRPDMHLIYLTNFMCGPDSFIKSFAMAGAGKPFLTLQFDGHGNDAGMMTRCEAYLDSKGLLQ